MGARSGRDARPRPRDAGQAALRTHWTARAAVHDVVRVSLAAARGGRLDVPADRPRARPAQRVVVHAVHRRGGGVRALSLARDARARGAVVPPLPRAGRPAPPRPRRGAGELRPAPAPYLVATGGAGDMARPAPEVGDRGAQGISGCGWAGD